MSFQDVLTILGAVYAVATAVSWLFIVIAKFIPNPKAKKEAQAFSDFIQKVASFFARFGIDITKKK